MQQLIRAAARRGYDDLVIAGFAFDGAAQAILQDPNNPNLRVHMAHIRPDVNPGMQGLLKDTPRAQLFTVFGLPRSRVEPAGDGGWRVLMEGVDPASLPSAHPLARAQPATDVPLTARPTGRETIRDTLRWRPRRDSNPRPQD